uniref:F-box domain-containing protein n=1 Tax=Aegilops tauschii TaxID=37682 RepID=R7WEX4_AEGTA
MVEHLLDLGEDLIAEILTHLPTRSVLVARAVCIDFRRVATSAAFLAAHARRRPLAPLEILLYDRTTAGHVNDYVYLDALSVSVRHPGRPARRPLARLPVTKPQAELLGEQLCLPLASCDGLLLLGTVVAGYADEPRPLDNVKAGSMGDFFSPSGCDMITPAVLRGSLHWLRHPEAGSAGEMAVFDTADETFRQMPAPPVANELLARLLVVDGSLMASEFRKLAVDLCVLECYAGATSASAGGTRWELRHSFEVPWQARMPTFALVVIGGDEEGDVVLGTRHGVAVYNMRRGTVRAVDVGPKGSKGFRLTQRVLRIRESLVRHTFFETQRHPGIPLLYWRFCSC